LETHEVFSSRFSSSASRRQFCSRPARSPLTQSDPYVLLRKRKRQENLNPSFASHGIEVAQLLFVEILLPPCDGSPVVVVSKEEYEPRSSIGIGLGQLVTVIDPTLANLHP
jgi:hypothetical protein